MAKELPDPDEYVHAFTPGINPFGISITKIFPPDDITTDRVRQAYLIKVVIVLNAPHDLWKYLENVLAAVRKERLFCDIWTPTVSPVGVDDYGAYAELTSYLKVRNEKKLIHFDKVIKASPKFGAGTAMAQAHEEDRVFVETFVEAVKGGNELHEAMEKTKKEAPVTRKSIGFSPSDKYVIGKTVVVKGKLAERLSEAEKRVEEDIED